MKQTCRLLAGAVVVGALILGVYAEPNASPADATGTASGIVRDVRVIDLSGEKYVVSDYAGVDTGTFNCDAYKTDKLVLMKVPAGAAYPVKPGKYKEPLDDTDVMTVQRDYWIGLFEVTESQYSRVMGGDAANSTRAQASVTYVDVRGTGDPTLAMTDEGVGDCFLRRLCERCVDKDGNPVDGFDLPTEIQWEIACRAGTKSIYFWGDALEDFADYAWCSENTDDKNRSQSVGLKKPNDWGLYDTCGNVIELCRDTSGKDPQSAAEDPAFGDDREIPSWVVRGGSYMLAPDYACLESSRRGFGRSAMKAQDDSGFRVVCVARYPFDATGAASGATNDVMVVDLSAGPTAERYPVSRLRSVDVGCFDCDAYKANKLALVSAADGLWVGVRPVTQGQYARVMGGSAAGPTNWQGGVSYETLRGTAIGAAWPAIRATDLGSFFATLGVKTGLGFDLPSDAEWAAGRDAGMTMPDAEWGEWLLGQEKSSAANVGFRVSLNETNAAIVVDGVWQVQDERMVEGRWTEEALFRFSKLSEALDKINGLPSDHLKTLRPSATLYANRPISAAQGASFGYDCAFVISNSNTIVDFAAADGGCLALSGAMPGDECQIRVTGGAKSVVLRNIEFGEVDDVTGEWKSLPACPYAVVAEPGGEVKLAYCQVTHGQMVRAFGEPADREGTLLNLLSSTLVSTNDVNPCVVSVSNAMLIVNRSTVAASYDLADKSRQLDGVRAIDARDALVTVENSAVVVGGARTAVGGSGTGIWLEGGALTLLVATIGDRENEGGDLPGWNGIHVERGALDIGEGTDVFVGVGNNALSFGDDVCAGDVRLANGMFYGAHAVDPNLKAMGFLSADAAMARFGRVKDQANDIKWTYCASNVVPFCHYNFEYPGLTPKENEYRPYGVVALADDDRIVEAGQGALSADGRTLTFASKSSCLAHVGALDLSVLAPKGIDGWNVNSDEAWSESRIVYIVKDAGGTVTTNFIGEKSEIVGPPEADGKYGVQSNGFCRVALPWHPTASKDELLGCASNKTALVRELTVFWDGKLPGEGGRANTYCVRWEMHPDGTADDPWPVGATTNDTVVAWTNANGRLVVAGKGAMKDFTSAAPWGTDVAEASVCAQVESIGANAFGKGSLETLVMGGNPPALGVGNDLSGVEIVVREDALAKFRADPVWRGLAAKFATVPVCYDWQNVKKLAPFLHEVWYDDYVFDEKGATLSKEQVFACSSVRNGNFIGRNLDFFLNDTPEFVVHVAADPSKGRLASVGMAMHSGMREDGVTNGQYTASYDLVPNRTVDGINECGVAINQNVVAYDPEVAAGPGQEFHGTNPDGEDLNISFVTRFVLDHATNAAHAVELIKSRNLVGISVSGDLLHYMVSDPAETYVVEIITNTVVARHMKVMTNFCLNWDNGNARAVTDADTNGCWTAEWYPEPRNLAVDKGSMPAITNAIAQVYAKHAEGVERFVRLRDNYAEGETFEGMANLLKRVMYSQAATLETQPYWYSDRTSVAVDELLKGAGYPDAANIRMLYALKYTGNLKLDELLDENLMADERTYLADKDRYRKADTGVWLTVHNTTYDIERRMFRVAVQEDCEHTFDIWLAEPQDVVDGGEVTYPKTPKGSAYLKTKSTATWKAKPYANFVFAGWVWTNGTECAAFAALSENERRNPSLKLRIDADEAMVKPTDVGATWALISDDAIGDVTLTPSNLVAECLSYVTATVSGLPSGLKFDKKSLAVTGVPKKPGDKAVTVTVRNGSGYVFRQSFAMKVAADLSVTVERVGDPELTGEPVTLWADDALGTVKGMKVYAADKKASIKATPAKNCIFLGWFADAGLTKPATGLPKGYLVASQSVVVPKGGFDLYARFVELVPWAVGTFNGGGTNGMVVLTVSNKGKLSGKWLSGGKTWKLSAASFDGYDAVGETYHALLAAKSGKETSEIEIQLSETGVASELFDAYRNGWKEEPLREIAKEIRGEELTRTVEGAGTFEFVVGSSGAVKVKGTFTGLDGRSYTATCSTVLIPDGEGTYSVYVYYPPKTNKFAGFSGRFDGIQF